MLTLSANLLSSPSAGLKTTPVLAVPGPRRSATFFSLPRNALLAVFPSCRKAVKRQGFSQRLAKFTFWGSVNGVFSINNWVRAKQQDYATCRKSGDIKPKKPNLLGPWPALALLGLCICQGKNHSKAPLDLIVNIHYRSVLLNLMRYEKPYN